MAPRAQPSTSSPAARRQVGPEAEVLLCRHRSDRGRSRRSEDSATSGAPDAGAHARPCPRPSTGRAVGHRASRVRGDRGAGDRRVSTVRPFGGAQDRLRSEEHRGRRLRLNQNYPPPPVRPSHRVRRPLHSFCGWTGRSLGPTTFVPLRGALRLARKHSRASVGARDDRLIIPIRPPSDRAAVTAVGGGAAMNNGVMSGRMGRGARIALRRDSSPHARKVPLRGSPTRGTIDAETCGDSHANPIAFRSRSRRTGVSDRSDGL